MIPSITVEGKTYTNVIKIESNNKSTYYWGKGVGIIRLERNVGTTKNVYALLRNG
jgi:hypothetical protein